MAEIYDTVTDEMITGGLDDPSRSDQAIRCARELAAELGHPVALVEDDGSIGIVDPSGEWLEGTWSDGRGYHT